MTTDTCRIKRLILVCTFSRLSYAIVTSDLFFLVAFLVQVVGRFLVARLLRKAVENAAGEGLSDLRGEADALEGYFEHIVIDLIM